MRPISLKPLLMAAALFLVIRSDRPPCATSAMPYILSKLLSALKRPVPSVPQALRVVNIDQKNTCSAARSVRWSRCSSRLLRVRSLDSDTPPPARPRDNIARARLIHTLLGRARVLGVLRVRSVTRSPSAALRAGWPPCAARKPRAARWRRNSGGFCTRARRGGGRRWARCRDRPRPRESASG